MMRSRFYRTTQQRKRKGQALVEGVVGLLLILAAIIVGIILLLDVGFSIYRKMQLGFVVNQTADYAANREGDPQILAQERGQEVLNALGLNSTNAIIKAKQFTIQGAPVVKVSVELDVPLFASNVPVLPMKVRLSDSVIAVKSGAAEDSKGQLSIRGVDGDPEHPALVDVTLPVSKIFRRKVTGEPPPGKPPTDFVLGPEGAYLINSSFQGN
jgi:hypothetical protein